MAKNEAKIKFTADTKEFTEQIQKSNNKMSQLRAEFKLNETQMKATGTTVEGLENKHKILSTQLETAKEKVEALSQKAQKAAEIFGENSNEAIKWQTQLMNARNAEEKLRQSVDTCSQELEEQRAAANMAESATEKLTNSLEDQQNELNKLKKEYTEAVLKYGETSDEAKKLEGEITELSGELRENKQKLSEASDKADELDKSLDDVEDSAKKAGDGFTVMKGALSNLVADGIQKAVDAMGEFVTSTIDTGVDFTSTMSSVQAISGATGNDLEALTQKAMDLGASTVFSASEVGDAMVEMAKAGWSTEQILSGMEGVLNASSASGEGLATVATIAADAISGFGLKASESTRVADLLTQAANAGTIGITDLGETFKYIAPVAGSMDLSIEDVTTAVTALSMSGIKGSQAGTSLRTMLTNLVKPSKNMAAAMEELGIEVANADGTMKPLDEIISILRGSFDGLTEEQKSYYAATLAGKTGMSGMLALMNLTQEEYDEIAKSMDNAKGVAQETSEVMLDNLGGDLEELGGNLETLKLELFDTFEGAMRDGVAVLNELIDGVRAATQWMTEHKAVVATIASVIGILTTAITAYNVVQGIKSAMEAANVTTVWALVSAHLAQAAAAIAAVAPYILIVAAIAAVIAIIVLCVKHWDKIVEAVKNAWEIVKSTLSEWGEWINTNVIQPIVNFFKGLWEDLKAIWDTICNVVQVAIMLIGSIISAAVDIITLPFRFIWENCKEYVFSAWEWIKEKVSSKINEVKSVISTVMNAIKKVFTTVWNAVKNTVTTVWNAIVNFLTPIINKIKTTITTVFNAVKSTVASIFNGIKSTVTSVWNGIRDAISNVVTAVKTKVTSVFNSVKSTVSSVFNGIKSTASSVWNGIKNAIITPIEAAKNKVKGIVDTIKGFFSKMKLSLPKIKLPHFKVTGKLSLNPPSVPKLSIDWYKDGGIMTRPTIFGVNGSSLMAGGEAGAEAILPIEKLKDYIADTVEDKMNVVNLSALADSIERLADRAINLNINGRNFATATASDSDNVNGLRTSFKGRGLAL